MNKTQGHFDKDVLDYNPFQSPITCTARFLPKNKKKLISECIFFMFDYFSQNSDANDRIDF